MESIIILAVLYFVFKSLTKKGNNVWNTLKTKIEEASDAQTGQTARPNTPVTRRHAERKAEPFNPIATKTNESGAAYVPIQPTIRANNAQYADSGSMSTLSQEGARSAEGTNSAEGTQTQGDPGKRLSATATVYAIGEAENTSVPILPAHWNTNAMAQAAVLSIVLERPRKWGDRIG